jgi:N-acetylglucosamine-6-sulfatase
MQKPHPLLIPVTTLPALLSFPLIHAQSPANAPFPPSAQSPRNIVFILTDDHRFDAMGFMGHPFLETPNLDRLARGGVHFANAFVTTSLCSPSRASIFTGLYAHRHRVVDNGDTDTSRLTFFPQLLQRAGYTTGFFGKWHMGGHGAGPRPGFDRWVSFRGQGEYWPDGRGTTHPVNPPNTLNVDGSEVPQRGYITDEITDYAIDWMRRQPADRPFFLHLSHKAVHSEFVPAVRHAGRYRNQPLPEPCSKNNHTHAPRWTRDQRNSWHGIDFPYHSTLDVAAYYWRYCETLLAVDESVGRVLAELQARGQLENTLVVYMGDNGFAFGEHGLIDKRTAYEESMRVPLIAFCPSTLPAGKTVREVVANIDIAPTLLEAAGQPVRSGLDGRSFWSLSRGIPESNWRHELLYEYFWERSFPQTPTMHALRTDRYKYIHVYGLWDIDEFYDLHADPGETRNLIFEPEYMPVVEELSQRLFKVLGDTDGMTIPFRPDHPPVKNLRRQETSAPASFPNELIVPSGIPNAASLDSTQ